VFAPRAEIGFGTPPAGGRTDGGGFVASHLLVELLFEPPR